jgi:hypothetical protein
MVLVSLWCHRHAMSAPGEACELRPVGLYDGPPWISKMHAIPTRS